MSLSRTVSETNGNFCRKWQIFSTPVYLRPAEGLLEFYNHVGLNKSILYQRVRDRQTDRRGRFAITIWRSACIGMQTDAQWKSAHEMKWEVVTFQRQIINICYTKQLSQLKKNWIGLVA